MLKVLNLIILSFSRLLVGVLFIFSGLVKANDPLGFTYKLEEYFEKFAEVFSASEFWSFLAPLMEVLVPLAFPLAIFLVVAEIVLGVLTLVGAYSKTVAWSLLGMIIFFTILTFVSWKFELVKSCGCFGDAIPLSPFESFVKDLVLLFFIIIFFINRNKIHSFFKAKGTFLSLSISTIVAFMFTWYCYQHLPFKDYRPYAPGKSLLIQMEATPGNPLTLFELEHLPTQSIVKLVNYPSDYNNWRYIGNESITGELTLSVVETDEQATINQALFIPEALKENWRFIEEITAVYTPDIEPKILQLSAFDYADFETDYLMQMFEDSLHYFWLTLRKLEEFGNFEQSTDGLVFKLNSKGEDMAQKIKNLHKGLQSYSLSIYALSSEVSADKIKAFKAAMAFKFAFYVCDDTELKTMIRSNAGLLLLKKDTVVAKWHQNDFPKFEKVNTKYLN